ncbi:hypothetical protein BGZ57DRAFT_890089 [Hyaloscypha finlandica]|nr:hypothetical protein BGZ57DRAFT_890089 [Hyaloscypha finlandica]
MTRRQTAAVFGWVFSRCLLQLTLALAYLMTIADYCRNTKKKSEWVKSLFFSHPRSTFSEKGSRKWLPTIP